VNVLGGYLALQSGLMYSSPRIKAVVASYPMIDMKSPWFNQSKEKLMFNIPMLPEAFLNDHLATIHAGGIVTSADPPDRLNLMFAIIQQRRILEFLGKDPSLFPLETIESVKMFPPLFIYHGRDDSVVPAEGTEKFVEKFTQNLPEAKLVFKLEPGEHGMDHETDIKEPWLQQGLELVTVEWLA